ncbi:LysR family transcriptional regulator [Aliivibrio fischeri]|uniref:LysR family transcriptional regulator n=1 Tax=Aliivibrio fischeri TaxID=668 RepID=UPI0012DA95F8|nr:LysR family transcriptional regulator [Aliivibrio fischeri]MUK93703.1 LysR family transcriptional regulator [Aliivibrio fischeri]
MKHKIHQLDLNLLKVFTVLLEVRNTRKASERLFLSQPGVSRALARLRDFFEDELFIRSHYGLTPTPKALEIGDNIAPAMTLLFSALEPSDKFDSSQLEGRINIAMNGFIAPSIASNLCGIILEKAPNVEVVFSNWDRATPENILHDQIQLGLNYFPLEISKQLSQSVLTTDRFVLIGRKEHPLITGEESFENAAQLDIAALVIPNWNEHKAYVVNSLKSLNKECRMRLRSSYLDVILNSIQRTDMLFPCSESLANTLGSDFQKLLLPDDVIQPGGEIGLVVASKNRRTPLIKWLKECTQEAAAEIKTYNLSQ